MEITAEPQKAPVKKDSSSEGDSGDPVKAAPDLFQDEALKETFFLRTEQQRFSRWVWGTIGAALLIQLVYLFTRFIDVTFTLKP